MSVAEHSYQEDTASQTDVPAHLVNTCVGTSERIQDTHGITINFYSGQSAPRKYVFKVDKPVQTENSYTVLVPESKDPKARKFGFFSSDSREIRSFEYTPPTAKKSFIFSHESKQFKLMSARKFFEKPSSRVPHSDLERKKLEAELKATEEIARIQQTVIEKRLALELASLQDTYEYHYKGVTPQHSTTCDDVSTSTSKASSDDTPTKKHVVTDRNCHQEATPTDPHPAIYSPSPSPPPKSSPPARPSPPPRLSKSGFKSDCSFLSQTSSELNPIRNLIEKKINLDRITSKTESKPPSASNSPEYYYFYMKQQPGYSPQGSMSCHHYTGHEYTGHEYTSHQYTSHHYREDAEYSNPWWPPDGPYIKDLMKRCLRKIYRGSPNVPETKEQV